MSLTPQRERFAVELAKGKSQADAYRIAYPNSKAKESTIWSEASTLAKNPKVTQRVHELMARAARSNEVTVERVLKERARLSFYDPRKFFDAEGNLIPVHKLDDDSAAAVAGVDVVEMAGGAAIGGKDGIKHVAMHTKKIKFADKNASLTALEKHLGMYQDGSNANAVLNINIDLR